MAQGEFGDGGNWRNDAACAQTDPEAFFPVSSGDQEPGEHTNAHAARRVCAICGVRPECLDYALVNDIRFGVWGGLSELERRKLKKSRAKDTGLTGTD